MLTNAVYAGAYVYGKTRVERYVEPDGAVRQRVVRLPQEEWAVLLQDHHEGYIDWETYEGIRQRLASNQPKQLGAAGAVREGAALLQGLARCGQCGRRVQVRYRSKGVPTYYCQGATARSGVPRRCFGVGGARIDRALAAAVLAAVRPAGVEAALAAAAERESGREAALEPLRLALERAEREAQRAERDYERIDRNHWRVAAKYEAKLEACLAEVERARGELERRERRRPPRLGERQRQGLLALGEDLRQVWEAPTTAARDRKELLRELLEEAVLTVPAGEPLTRIELRWQGGQTTALEVDRDLQRASPLRTAEDTVALLGRLAVRHGDATIAQILNRQGKTTARGLPFTRNRVASLRRHWKIPCYEPPAGPAQEWGVSVRQAARELGLARSTVLRWIKDGLLPAEQVTPGAPWLVHLTPEVRARMVAAAPAGYRPMSTVMQRLGVTRATVLEWVRSGRVQAVMVCRGKRKGLAIGAAEERVGLFERSADG